MEGGRQETETIGQRVRRLREARGLSQRELAEPGISYAYISRIEADARTPSLKALRLLAGKLGVPPDYIETGAWLPPTVDREIRVSDADLELRLHRDLEKAEAIYRAAVEENAEPALVARARVGLGILASQRGDNAAAIDHLSGAVETGYVPPDVRPDAWETLGAALAATNAPDRAVAVFERGLALLREPPENGERDASLEVRFTAYLANAYSTQGAVERARQVLDELESLEEEASPEARVFASWTRARLAWMRFEAHAALSYIHSAIGVLRATEDTLQLARAHLACAQLINLDTRTDEPSRRHAARHLAEAEPLLALGGDDTDLGVLRAEQAKLASLEEDAEGTMRLATEAAGFLGEDVRYRGLRSHVLGIAYALNGDMEQAEPNFVAALNELEQRRQWREGTEVARVWARFLRAAGRETEALDVLEHATVLNARQVGMAHRWRVRESPARAE